jgi:hypothetical protein
LAKDKNSDYLDLQEAVYRDGIATGFAKGQAVPATFLFLKKIESKIKNQTKKTPG